MIETAAGDILATNVGALVNTVNCVGISGRGIALQFRNAFPANFKAYEAACKRGEVQPGRMFVFGTGQPTNPRFIINFPTKRHWRDKSRLEDIDSGLEALVLEVRRRDIQSIAIPALGCGLGGLRWSDVHPKIKGAFAALPNVRALLFGPSPRPATTAMVRSTEVSARDR